MAVLSDVAHAHFESSVPMTHLHNIDEHGWTYTNKKKGGIPYYTWIDHMYASAELVGLLEE